MQNNKGGRPRKNIAEKLKYRVVVKLCTADYYNLKAKATSAGMKLSEVARLAVIGCKIRERFTPEILSHLRNLGGMGNNLNQIARKINAAGYTPDNRAEYLGLAGKIDDTLDRLYDDDQDH